MTQTAKLITEIERRSKLSGINAYITIREIEEDLQINGAYTVLSKVKKLIPIHSDSHENLSTGTRFMIYRKGEA